MPKASVQSIMDALTTKPAPLEVIIAEPKLKSPAQLLQYLFAVALVFQLRTAVVWGVLAILAPQLGITWFMVMLGLYAIRHIVPTDLKAVVKGIASR